jgi:hypothetical protein
VSPRIAACRCFTFVPLGAVPVAFATTARLAQTANTNEIRSLIEVMILDRTR